MWRKICSLPATLKVVGIAAHYLVAALVVSVGPAAADPLQTPQQSEDAGLRQELERISKEDPQRAADARKTLEALDLPASSPQGRPLRNRRERGARRIVNGIHTIRHSAVAAILNGNDPSTASAWCTGTLVGCDRVLTAAHCIAENPKPQAYLVYFQNLGFFEVKDISWPKAEYSFPYADLAMLTLTKAVEGLAPISLNTVASPINGSIGTIVGYGRTGGTRQDYGVKREGSVKFGACKGAYADKKLLCWDFDADYASRQESNTCNADSGGGVFMFDKEGQRSVQRVVGVVSGGLDQDCVKQDHSYNTDVFQWRGWLALGSGGRPSATQTCGSTTNIDAPSNLRSQVVELGPDRPGAIFELDVPVGTAILRVAMSGEDDGKGKNDFDLFLFQGQDTAAHPVCEQSGSGQFGFCEVSDPASERWTIELRWKKGAGSAQLAVTTVPD